MEEKTRMEKFFEGTGPGNSEAEAWQGAGERYDKVMNPEESNNMTEQDRIQAAVKKLRAGVDGCDEVAFDEWNNWCEHMRQAPQSWAEIVRQTLESINGECPLHLLYDRDWLAKYDQETAEMLSELYSTPQVPCDEGELGRELDDSWLPKPPEREQTETENPLAWTERCDGAQLEADARAEMPRLEEEARQWQEQYNTPRAPETETKTEQTTEQTATETTEQTQGQDEELTPRLRPGL